MALDNIIGDTAYATGTLTNVTLNACNTTSLGIPYIPTTEPIPPKAINDIRSIGIPSSAPMFNAPYTWEVGDLTLCTPAAYDPWVTTDRYFATNATTGTPINYDTTFGNTTAIPQQRTLWRTQ